MSSDSSSSSSLFLFSVLNVRKLVDKLRFSLSKSLLFLDTYDAETFGASSLKTLYGF